MKENKNICKKTLSGKHLMLEDVVLEWGTKTEPYVIEFPKKIGHKCFACGMIDDKEKND